MKKLIWQTEDGYKFEWVQMAEPSSLNDGYGQWHEFNVEDTDMYFEGTRNGPVDGDGELLSGGLINA